MQLYGVSVSIISDWNPQFTAHRSMRTHMRMSIVFHPYTDGQLKRTIQVLEDML